MKKQGLIIICHSWADAVQVRKALNIFQGVNQYINKNHLVTKNANYGQVVGWWQQDCDPVVPEDFPNPVFIQGELSAKDLIKQVKAYYVSEKAQSKHNFEVLSKLFPEFKYEEFDRPLNFGARLIYKNGKYPIDLDDIEAGYNFLFNKWLDQHIFKSYQKRWPFLYVSSYIDYWEHDKHDVVVYVYIIHSLEHPSDSTNTGVHVSYPITLEESKEMNRLNSEAQKVVENRDQYFFCSGCHQAKPREEYAAYLFSVVKCKACATPAFIKAAKEETYN